MLDRPTTDPAQIPGNLREMERMIRLLGVPGYLLRLVRRQLSARPAGEPLSVLDIGSGSGWLPRLLSDAGGRAVAVTAVDIRPEVLHYARALSVRYPEVCFRWGDARRLTYAPGSFDVVTCSMVLHHLCPQEAVDFLQRIDTIATRLWLVCDLLRSRPVYWMARFLTRVTCSNPLTRHDGPLSVRKAFDFRELKLVVRSVWHTRGDPRTLATVLRRFVPGSEPGC